MKKILLINIIGKDDFFALKFNNKLISKKLGKKENKNDLLVSKLLIFLRENNFIIDRDTLILINIGPGSFSSLRVSLSVAKGINIVKKAKIFGYKKKDLKELTLKNLQKLMEKNLLEKDLIKPIYLS